MKSEISIPAAAVAALGAGWIGFYGLLDHYAAAQAVAGLQAWVLTGALISALCVLVSSAAQIQGPGMQLLITGVHLVAFGAVAPGMLWAMIMTGLLAPAPVLLVTFTAVYAVRELVYNTPQRKQAPWHA